MNKFMVIVMFLVATPHISGQKEIDFNSDKSLNKIFNQKEIEGLKSMVQFVDHMVEKSTNEDNPNKAYHLYFEKISKTPEYMVPFEENVKYRFLKSLDSTQFAMLWNFSQNAGIIKYRDSIYRNPDFITILELKPFSKYMDYLKEIGKDDPYYKFLQQEFERVGNLMQGSSEWFVRNHKKFDFDIPKNRLWAAIYLLRREESIEMKLDKYFKNK